MAGNRNSGRRPKPAAVLKMEGTYRHDRHDGRQIEIAADGKPVCPQHLKGESRKFWKRVATQLIKLGVAKAIDTDALEAMANWWAMYRAANDVGDINAAVKSWEKFLGLADRFGLTPTARIKLTVPQPKQQTEDPAAKYFG